MPRREHHRKRVSRRSAVRPIFSLLSSHFSLRRHGVPFLALAALATSSGCTGVYWERDQQAGLRKAVDNDQRAVIEFVSGFDSATRKMDSEVFSDPDVVKLMRRFVAIRLEAGTHKKLAEQCGVTSTPAFVVVRPDMSVSGAYQGTMKADQFRLFLIRNSLN